MVWKTTRGTARLFRDGCLMGDVRYIRATSFDGVETVLVEVGFLVPRASEGRRLTLRFENGEPFIGQCVDVSQAPWFVLEQRGPLWQTTPPVPAKSTRP